MFDATFWVAVSFVIFFVGLSYLKVRQNVNSLLTKMIVDIKNEIDESEKLRSESKKLLDDAQSKLNSAEQEKKKIIDQANIEAEKLTNDMSEKFSKSAEIKKNLEEEIEIAEKEIQNLNKSSAENIKKIAAETSSGLIKQLIGEEINKENISSIVNDLTNNSKENRKNV